MANLCVTCFAVVGEAAGVKALGELMERLAREREDGCWVGHLVEAVGGDPSRFECLRGWWSDLVCLPDRLLFYQESDWKPLFEVWDFIADRLGGVKVFFSAEEPGMGLFLKRDNAELSLFPENFFLEFECPDGAFGDEYCCSLSEVCRCVAEATSRKPQSMQDLLDIHYEWEEEGGYLMVHPFTTITP